MKNNITIITIVIYLIFYKNINAISNDNAKYFVSRETYDEYKKTEKNMMKDPKKYKWIYDIIFGSKAQDKIIYRDDKFILIPDHLWDEKNINQIYFLAFVTDK